MSHAKTTSSEISFSRRQRNQSNLIGPDENRVRLQIRMWIWHQINAPPICRWDGSGAGRNVGSPRVMSDTSGAATLETTSHLFSQVSYTHCLCRMDHQHLKRCSTFCLSSWPLQITQHKRWNVAAATRAGQTEDSYGSGDWYGAHFASPLAVCPQPRWPLNNEPFSA